MEAVITTVLVIGLVAMIDPKNPLAPGANIAPIMIGAIVAVIGGTFGNLTGFAMNPARDLGPKLFEANAGWGHLGIPGPGGYMWVPIVGPLIGAVVGILLYDNLIAKGLHRVNEPVLEAVGGVETDMADEPVTRVTT